MIGLGAEDGLPCGQYKQIQQSAAAIERADNDLARAQSRCRRPAPQNAPATTICAAGSGRDGRDAELDHTSRQPIGECHLGASRHRHVPRVLHRLTSAKPQ